jgi:hypothetical protein
VQIGRLVQFLVDKFGGFTLPALIEDYIVRAAADFEAFSRFNCAAQA